VLLVFVVIVGAGMSALLVFLWTARQSLVRGRSALDGEQWVAAAAHLSAYLRSRPEDAEGWMLLARAQSNLNDLEACIHSLRQVPRDSAHGTEALLRIGQSLREAFHGLESERVLKDCIALCQATDRNRIKQRAQGDLLNIYLLEERWREAEELLWAMYRAWPPLDEDSKPLLVALMGLAFNRTAPESGVATLEKFVRQNSNDDQARLALGRYLIQLGRTGEGQALIEQCLRRQPLDVRTRSFWIWCLYELGDADAASEALRELPPGWEDFAELWTYRARAQYDLGEYQASATTCRKALERYPWDRQAHFQLGRALRRLGEREDSERHDQTADGLRKVEERRLTLFEDVTLRRSRPTPDECQELAEICVKTGMPRLAREWARFALGQDSKAPPMPLLKLIPLGAGPLPKPPHSPASHLTEL
jgi:tetratricopeptide (TPR) repeat protein